MSNASGRRKVITRNFTSDAKFSASKFPRSGLDLSYSSKDTGCIGRIWVSGYQHLQPKDSFSGGTAGSVTFNKLVTPVAPELHQHTYVFQTRHRSVDSDYFETMNPNELNSYGASAHFPVFQPCRAAGKFLRYVAGAAGLSDGDLYSIYSWYVTNNTTPWTTYVSQTLGVTSDATYLAFRGNLFTNIYGLIENDLENAYRGDYKEDIRQQLISFMPADYTSFNTIDGAYCLLRAVLLVPMLFFGQGSFMDQFGYPVMSLYPIHAKTITGATTDSDFAECLMFGGKKWVAPQSGASAEPLYANEYALRHFVSIWIEYLRNVHLEKRQNWMKYRTWTSSSFMDALATSSSWAGISANSRTIICAMLAPLSTYYAEDLVTSAQVDAAFKHVYAPIVARLGSGSPSAYADVFTPMQDGTPNAQKVSVSQYQALVNPASTGGPAAAGSARQNTTPLMHNSLRSAQISYMNPDNTITNINCPIPSNVNDFLLAAYGTQDVATIVQDFGVVRTMHNVENYLKRKWYFGDEYQDEMKAQHDVDLSDTALLKPKLIAGGVQLISDQQMVATNGTDPSKEDSVTNQASIGSRVAKQEGNMPNVNYSGFADEFGMLIQLSWILPTAHYDPSCVQNYARGYLDMPLPVMASTNESIINTLDFSRTQNKVVPFGHAQSYSAWRTRLNEAHGDFLDNKCDWYLTRWFANDTSAPVLNYKALRCSQLQLGMYQDSILLDGQFWVLHTNVFHVMRQLPSNVEYC